MKKTLIALAVAASAAVSGSAMAWEANGTGGSVNIGGSLTPAENITPWEVKTGAAVTGLDADITKGQSVINIAVDQAIPVLGIRTQTNQPFQGAEGISPQVNFNGAIDPSQFKEGNTTLTLDVKDNGSNKIGSLTTKVTAGALLSWTNDAGRGNYFSLASINKAGEVFNGGLSTNYDGALDVDQVKSIAPVIFPGSMDNFTDQGTESLGKYFSGIGNDAKYSAFYASGIEQGKIIKITLDQAASGDAPIQWKASLPVTVSYQ
ncbi:TPA: hypothetical protein SI321_004935 [Escherichia coli]|nr:hypothetical protein [Escherichia coli]HBA8841141.1 hypothetical protein [Escherichia coli]HBA8873468.1 hypothetical protein [Escherichia coli]HBB0091461.1 hypothetical protein [Escherichia coli]HEI3186063.1 hypothetical protein [Escherichia coli]